MCTGPFLPAGRGARNGTGAPPTAEGNRVVAGDDAVDVAVAPVSPSARRTHHLEHVAAVGAARHHGLDRDVSRPMIRSIHSPLNIPGLAAVEREEPDRLVEVLTTRPMWTKRVTPGRWLSVEVKRTRSGSRAARVVKTPAHAVPLRPV